MEEQPPIWRTAANILNKQPIRSGPPAGGLGKVLITPYPKNWHSYKTHTHASGLG